MGLFGINWSNWRFERDRTGDTFYYKIGQGNTNWNDVSDKIRMGYSHPILMPGLQLIANYFSRVKFNEGEDARTDQLIKVLKKPNIYQTQDDFLKQFVWFKYASGFVYMLPVTILAKDDPSRLKYLYNLKPNLIKFDEKFQTMMPMTTVAANKELAKKFVYDDENQNLEIAMKEIMPYYDMANGLFELSGEQNMWVAPSRLDTLKKPLQNIDMAFNAKNIVINSNGKELFVNKTQGNMAKVMMHQEEKDDLQRKLNANHALGAGRSRSIFSNSDLLWQSLHIKLKELGLDDSVVSDAKVVINALGIPPELYSVDGNSATFENQSKAVIHFIQGKIQAEMNDFTNTLNMRFGTKLKGTFDHLPIFREAEKQKALGMKSISATCKQMVDAGIWTTDRAREEYEYWLERT
jgi:hypothetical protein